MHDSALVFFTAVAIVLCLLPLPMQWRARNTGTLLNIFWNVVGNTTWFLNAVVWWNRYDNRAPVLCDFSVKLQTGIAPGLTAASLCINRRLASIAMSRAVTSTPNKRRIDLAIDLSLGVGLPIVIMALSYIVQMHRYDIFEGFGCEMAFYPSIPALFILYLAPIVLGVISAIYGGLAVSYFLSRRLQFSALLKSSQSGLDTNQYIRLVALASLDLFISLPLNIFFLAISVPAAVARQWPGLADVHYNWLRVDLFPAASLEPTRLSIVIRMLARWVWPALAILFFIFFGVSRDAIAEYWRYYNWVVSKLRGMSGVKTSAPTLFVPKLGSAVAEPLGAQWNSPRRDKDDLEVGLGSAPSAFSSGPRGMAVVVKVEKETV